MKIWEAIQMLEQMDQTKEVTVTFGPVLKKTNSWAPSIGSPPFTGYPANPNWVIGKEQWDIRTGHTCDSKVH